MKNPPNPKTPLTWVKNVKPEVLAKMLPHKLDPNYSRPTFLDTLAQKAIIISKRSTCVWNEVGAIIFYPKGNNGFHLSDGYNGAVLGDVDPRFAGCARVVGGELREGAGLCRGSHAELNAIGNLTVSTFNYDNLGMMVTLRPCFQCAKQIVNKGIKAVYYLWEYDQDEHALDWLRVRGLKVEKYRSKFLDEWIAKNGYTPPRIAEKK
jgi:dCMP deaminase